MRCAKCFCEMEKEGSDTLLCSECQRKEDQLCFMPSHFGETHE